MLAIHDQEVSSVTHATHRRPHRSCVRSNDDLATALAGRVAAYDGPIQSTTGRMLQAIQAWYLDLQDENSAEAILAKHTQLSCKIIPRPR